MKKLTRQRLLASTLIIGSAFAATPAFAQAVPATPETTPTVNQDTATPSEQAAEATNTGEDIVVTGSLIRNPNLVSSSPVNAVGADEIDLRQTNTAEQLLRELPGAVPSIGSAVNNGNGGASYVDLRGLGSNRNVVLLDGVRLAPSELVGRVDLNNIPLAIVQRVDSLTGAAVTTYGADAITGVVNFVTRTDFAGLEVNASEQITERGDGNIFRIDATIGANFADGRGNAVLSIGYQEADPVYQGDRDFSITQVDSYTGRGGGSGTSVPSTISGTRPQTNGVINTTPAFVQTGVTAAGVPILAPVTGGVANGGNRQIDPATGFARAAYAPFNFNPYNIFQTPFERYNIFGSARYEISDAIEVYSRGIFSKNTVETIIAPSGSFGSSVTVNLNNPFLPANLRNQLCAFNVAPTVTGVNAAGASVSGQATYTPRFTPAQCAAAATATGRTDPNYREVTFNLSRRTTEAGPRTSTFQTTFFDYRLGFRGALTDNLDWDIGGSYGESENIQTLGGYILTSRVRQSLLVDGTAAAPVCQNQNGGCVPANFFGPEGSLTTAATNFLSAASSTTNRTSLGQVRGTVSGDLGFSLPWATEAVGIAVGGEFREYTAQQASDTLAQTPGELGGAGGAAPNINGGFNVWEAFGELIVPLVSDKPFFKSLTIEGGARYSSYKVNSPGNPTFETTTWKAGGTWEPTDGVRIRGNYNRAVRAPNISELFSPLNTVLTNLSIDPCAGAAPVANANLRAVCLAQGAPAGTIGSINNPTAGQANITSGGNLNLQPETASTWTAGAVLTPSFIPGFTLSADYYNIKVKDVVGAPLPGDLIGACFNNLSAASATSTACTVIRRNSVTGALDGAPDLAPGLFAPLSNLGKLETDGVDVTMNYTTGLGSFGRLSLGFVGNWTHSSKYQATPTGLDRECVGFYSVNCSFTGSIQPEFQFSQRTTLTVGDVDISLLWRFIDSVQYEPAAFADDLAAAVGAGCADPQGADPDGCIVNPEFRRIPEEHYFDLTMRFNATDNLAFSIAAINLFDNQPTVVGNTVGATTYNSGNVYPSTYDALGRRFSASARLKF